MNGPLVAIVVLSGFLLFPMIRNAVADARLERLRQLLLHALHAGIDLGPVTVELSHVTSRMRDKRVGATARDGELRMMHAVAAMEQLQLDVATTQLSFVGRSRARRMVDARLALLRGTSDGQEMDRKSRRYATFGGVLSHDTLAQLAIHRGEPERAAVLDDILPPTRAPLLALARRDDEALVICAARSRTMPRRDSGESNRPARTARSSRFRSWPERSMVGT